MEITKDGFRGQAKIASKVVVDELNAEAFSVELETATLTYNGSFALHECKVQ